MDSTTQNQEKSPTDAGLKLDTQVTAGRTGHRHAKRNWLDLLTVLIFLGDTLGVLGGLMIGFWVRFQSGWIPLQVDPTVIISSAPSNFTDYLQIFVVGIFFFHATFIYLGFYSLRTLCRFRPAAEILFRGIMFWVIAYVGVSLCLKFDPPISRLYAFLSFFCVLGMVLVWRWVVVRVLQVEYLMRNLRERFIIVGWTPEAERLVNSVLTENRHHYEVVGYVPSSGASTVQRHPGVPVLGALGEMERLLIDYRPDIVLLADVDLNAETTVGLANLCEKEYVQFKQIPSYFQILISGLQLEIMNGVPLLGVSELPLDKLENRLLKRFVDVVGAIVGLIISAPFIIICGILIYLESPGPIFYRQTRCGYKGKLFKIIKLRSMKLNAETKGAQWAVKDDPRRLRIGAFLRKWNLDELPQFWNVLNGEMSLVGPRPERPELIVKFKEEVPHYNARHVSKPGITGWAQVNGYRGDTSLVERVRFDLFYLENWNVWLDFQIMFQTFLRYDNAG